MNFQTYYRKERSIDKEILITSENLDFFYGGNYKIVF